MDTEGYRFDKYDKSDDYEGEEEAGIDVDDRVDDLTNALEEAGGKLTRFQFDGFQDVIDTISVHSQDDPEEAEKLFDETQELIDEIIAGDPEERIERQEEFDDKIRDLNKKAENIGK